MGSFSSEFPEEGDVETLLEITDLLIFLSFKSKCDLTAAARLGLTRQVLAFMLMS